MNLFYLLIQLGLWADNPERAKYLAARIATHHITPAQWKELLQAARKQTVMGLIARAVDLLPPSVKIDPAILRELMMVQVRNGQSHQMLNRVLWQLSTRLHEARVPHVLLKGQGLAQEYADPLTRQCGDIDMYVGEEHYPRVCQLMRQWQFCTEEDEMSSEKHLHLTYQGVSIEIHRVAALMLRPWQNAGFAAWTRLGTNDTLQEMWVNSEGIASLHHDDATASDDVRVNLPEATFNAFFIFYHLYYHFLFGGVGLRQLCDWCRYLYCHRAEIDTKQLQQALNTYHLRTAWQAFGTFAVYLLGLPTAYFPCYCKRAERHFLRLQNRIETDGNFGFAYLDMEKRPTHMMQGKLYSFKKRSARAIDIIRMFPADGLYSFAHFLTTGMSNIFVDRYRREQEIHRRQQQHQQKRQKEQNNA